MSNKKTKQRLPSLDDLKQVITFKTFYIAVVTGLIGLVLILLEAVILPQPSNSVWKGVFLALGLTLLTSSTVAVFSEMFLRFDIVDFVTEKIVEILPHEITLRDSGLQAFGANRTSLDFPSIWKQVSGFMKVIGFSANDVLSPQNTPLLIERLKTERTFHLQILIINPWSVIAQRRAESPVYKTKYEFIRRVWAIFLEMRDTADQLNAAGIERSQFDVRIYDSIPSLSMIIDDDKAIVTPVLITRQGGSSPFFVLKETSSSKSPYLEYKKHFDSVWETGVSIIGANMEELYSRTVEIEKLRSNMLPSDIREWMIKNIIGTEEVSS
jgi:hypothetical protein